MTRTLTKKLAHIKPGTLFIGIDLALKSNVAVVINQQAAHLDRFGFPNERGGYEFFRRRLLSHQERQDAPAVMVGMEPTNYFWKPLATAVKVQVSNQPSITGHADPRRGPTARPRSPLAFGSSGCQRIV